MTQLLRGIVESQTRRFRISSFDSEDIIQEVWLELYAELSRIREPQALPAWIKVVSSHKCLAWKKKQAYTEEFEVSAANTASPEVLSRTESDHLLREAVNRLPKRCQLVVKLLFVRGLSYGELATELSVASGSIGFIRGRCLEKLRRVLKDMRVLPLPY